MSDGKIIYSLIAKGTKPLVAYSNYTGTFDQVCINYLKNIGPGSSAAVKLDDGYIIFYINENNITFLIMTDSLYPKEAALGCLESIKKEFFQTFDSSRDFERESNFGLNDEFKTKLRMKFDYFNTNKDVSNESLALLKDELNKMKDEVIEASGLLNDRSDKIKVLDEKSDALSRDSNTFYRQSKRVKRSELMKKIKIYAGIGCAILVIIYVLIAIVCSPTFQC
jgi:hypothetical protein